MLLGLTELKRRKCYVINGFYHTMGILLAFYIFPLFVMHIYLFYYFNIYLIFLLQFF